MRKKSYFSLVHLLQKMFSSTVIAIQKTGSLSFSEEITPTPRKYKYHPKTIPRTLGKQNKNITLE